jgi:hypothetical protein
LCRLVSRRNNVIKILVLFFLWYGAIMEIQFDGIEISMICG